MSRARILSILLALLALSAALGACGGGGSDDPQAILDEATLQGIDSGKLDLTIGLDIEGKEGGDVDVGLSGPFRSEDEADAPEMALDFALNGDVEGEKLDREASFTLLGKKAYVGYEGVEYAVDPTTYDFAKSIIEQRAGRDQAGESPACQDAARSIEPGDFTQDLKDEGRADVGGTETTKISAEIDGPAAVEAVAEFLEDPACRKELEAAGSGTSQGKIDEVQSFARRSFKSAHADFYVGDDHITRRMVMDMKFDPPDGARAEAFDIAVDLTLTDVNEEVTIAAPARAKPLSALFIKLGINPLELLDAFQGGGAPDIGGLLEKLDDAGGGSGGSGGGRESYYECLGDASTPVDMQNCTGQLQ